ncbi:MAG: hypothetical protein LRZ87_00930 [Methanocellales archaeon]|nr:hypothetical protein [Methanocellales archaeon]
MVNTELVTTGIKSLDVVLGGGVPPGTTILLLGESGVGAEVFAGQFVFGGLENGENAFYFSTEKHIEGIRSNMARLGFDVQKYEREKKIDFIDAYTPRFAETLPAILTKRTSAQNIIGRDIDQLGTLRSAIERDHGKKYRGAIDSISFFLRHYELEVVTDIIEVMSSIGQITGGLHLLLMTKGIHDTIAENIMKHVADGVFELVIREKGDRLERSIIIRKLRGMPTPTKIFPYIIGHKGIELDTTTRVL